MTLTSPRPRRLAALLLLLLAAAVIVLLPNRRSAPGTPAPPIAHAGGRGCAGIDTAASRLGPQGTRSALLCLLNAQRDRTGRVRLMPLRAITRAAQAHARDMVAHRYFGHVTPSGVTMLGRIRASGYLRGSRRFRLGETLGYGIGIDATPRAVFSGLMHSPPHRQIIEDGRFRQIGVGAVTGAPDGIASGLTVTLDFGVRHG